MDVFQDRNGPNHGLTLKIQWFLLTKFLHTHLQASCGKDSSRKVELGWGKVPSWECLFCSSKTGIILVRCTWMLNWLERGRTWTLPCCRNWWKKLMLTNQLRSLITYTWDALNVNAARTRYFLWIHRNVRITNFCWSNWKITRVGKASRKDGCVVLRHGWHAQNALRDIANWLTKRRSHCTKSQVLAWMIIISRKRNMNQLENCQMYACTWHELVDLTF